MSQTPPFRSRPNLHLSLTPLMGSPVPSRLNSSLDTPFGTTNYSPFRSAGLHPPTPYGSPAQFAPRRPKSHFGTYIKQWIRRVLGSKVVWFTLFFLGLVWWWSTAGKHELALVRMKSGNLGKGILAPEITRGLKFFPASDPKIHYVGRWTAAPNRLRRDGTFPGVYLDIKVSNTTTLLLSLNNAPVSASSSAIKMTEMMKTSTSTAEPVHLSFHTSADKHPPASPISLLARVDKDEYILLPNSTGLVSIRSGNLDAQETHDIRIIAPMTDDKGRGIVEFEGVWLDKGGRILRVEGSQLDVDVEDEDTLYDERWKVGEKHRLGLSSLIGGKHDVAGSPKPSTHEEEDEPRITGYRRKMLEIITDSPGSFGNRHPGKRTGGVDGLLAGVMGWEYLLGEMFSVDHVGIGIDGMCLVQGCIGGVGYPAGMGDAFFRSGPDGSEYFEHPWMFQAHVPDVIIINVGAYDQYSFDKYTSEYNETAWDLSERFENTYVSLIKAIRELAYPKLPAVIAKGDTYTSSSASAAIPIFIMRPLRGQLEHATQGVANRLRADGDKSVFWLDTSGWLETDSKVSEDQDFFLDESTPAPRWRLTEQGNQRVAIFLHMHVCRYLAAAGEKCAFLPPEIYEGKVFTPTSSNLDTYVENEKERKLKDYFRNE